VPIATGRTAAKNDHLVGAGSSIAGTVNPRDSLQHGELFHNCLCAYVGV
jgi:hypothetical protein